MVSFSFLGLTQHATFSCFSDQSRKVQCCPYYLWVCDEGQVSFVKGRFKLCVIHNIHTAEIPGKVWEFSNILPVLRFHEVVFNILPHNMILTSESVDLTVKIDFPCFYSYFNLPKGHFFLYLVAYVLNLKVLTEYLCLIRYAGVTWLWMRVTEWRTITVN